MRRIQITDENIDFVMDNLEALEQPLKPGSGPLALIGHLVDVRQIPTGPFVLVYQDGRRIILGCEGSHLVLAGRHSSASRPTGH